MSSRAKRQASERFVLEEIIPRAKVNLENNPAPVAMVNLSKLEISQALAETLNKGFKFIPDEEVLSKRRREELEDDVRATVRKIKLKNHFARRTVQPARAIEVDEGGDGIPLLGFLPKPASKFEPPEPLPGEPASLIIEAIREEMDP
jgi:hypothetical protein